MALEDGVEVARVEAKAVAARVEVVMAVVVTAEAAEMAVGVRAAVERGEAKVVVATGVVQEAQAVVASTGPSRPQTVDYALRATPRHRDSSR